MGVWLRPVSARPMVEHIGELFIRKWIPEHSINDDDRLGLERGRAGGIHWLASSLSIRFNRHFQLVNNSSPRFYTVSYSTKE